MIADGLSQNNTLMSLDLSDNAFGNVGAISLAEALHKNTSLTELQLSNNRIGGFWVWLFDNTWVLAE